MGGTQRPGLASKLPQQRATAPMLAGVLGATRTTRMSCRAGAGSAVPVAAGQTQPCARGSEKCTSSSRVRTGVRAIAHEGYADAREAGGIGWRQNASRCAPCRAHPPLPPRACCPALIAWPVMPEVPLLNPLMPAGCCLLPREHGSLLRVVMADRSGCTRWWPDRECGDLLRG